MVSGRVAAMLYGAPRVRKVGLILRQAYRAGRALTNFAGQFNGAAVRRDDRFGNGQAQAAAAFGARRIASKKSFERVRKVGGGDAPPRVTNS